MAQTSQAIFFLFKPENGRFSPVFHENLALPLSSRSHTARRDPIEMGEGCGMRRLWVVAVVLTLTQTACRAGAQQQEPAGTLVREVVYNELHDHQSHGYWRYWSERRSQNETRLEEQLETADGTLTRLILSNGHPLSAEMQQQEQARVHRLLASPAERARLRRQYEEDEDRIGRILTMLPDAFLYEYAADENGCHRLVFHPNPNYPAHTIEARIFHAMSGTLWIDARYKHLARLDAHVEENVDFGYGILGRLYKGGWFLLERTQVGDQDWKTTRLEVHMNIRALLIKSFARETSETRGGFMPVPGGMSLGEGVALLEQPEMLNGPKIEAQSLAAREPMAPAAFALNP